MVIVPRLIASVFLLTKYIFYMSLEAFPLPPKGLHLGFMGGST